MDNNDEMLASYIESAPEIPEEKEEEVLEKEEEKVDEKKDDDPSHGIDSEGKKEESGEDVVKRVKSELNIDKEKEEAGETIPVEFTKVCLAQGWSEDDIKEFATGLDNEALLEMIPEIIGDGEKGEEKKAESKKSEEKPKSKSKATDEKAKDDTTKAELAALRKKVEELEKGNAKNKQEDAKNQEAALIATVNQVFDEASKDFEIFGKTDELLRYPAGSKKGQVVMGTGTMVAREEVWQKAVPFIQSGTPVKEAMQIAMTWYKGQNLEKDVHRAVVKDLKKHESKLSAKRSSKETKKTYKDDDARKEAVVRGAAKDAGVKNYGD